MILKILYRVEFWITLLLRYFVSINYSKFFLCKMIIVTTSNPLNFSFVGLNRKRIKLFFALISSERSLMPRLFSSCSINVFGQINCFVASSTNLISITKIFELIRCLLWPTRWAQSKFFWRRIPRTSEVRPMFIWIVTYS